jgi:hypothetical protein
MPKTPAAQTALGDFLLFTLFGISSRTTLPLYGLKNEMHNDSI